MKYVFIDIFFFLLNLIPFLYQTPPRYNTISHNPSLNNLTILPDNWIIAITTEDVGITIYIIYRKQYNIINLLSLLKYNQNTVLDV